MLKLCAALLLALCAAAAAADYSSLAETLGKAGAEAGISRYAIGEFAAFSGATLEKAAAAKSALAQELSSRPGTAVMDAQVLSEINLERRWPQAYVEGGLHGRGAGQVLVVKVMASNGRRIGIYQLNFSAGLPAAADLRDAPGEVSACERTRRAVQLENRKVVNLKARYWAERMRSPDFNYRTLPAIPGSELKEYAVKQLFCSLMNTFYNQDGPVQISAAEKKQVEKLMDREKAYADECGGVESR